MKLDDLRRLLASAPFHDVLQFELVEAREEEGELTVKLPFDPRYTILADAGSYHGGVLATLLDVAGTFCCMMGAGKVTPTMDLRIDYLQSAARCDLYARARLVRLGRTTAVADVEATDEDGRVFAVARGAWRVPG